MQCSDILVTITKTITKISLKHQQVTWVLLVYIHTVEYMSMMSHIYRTVKIKKNISVQNAYV